MDRATVPGPEGGPLGVKNIYAFQQDPLGFLARMREEHGDVVRIRFGTADVYLLAHPDHARRILVEQHRATTTAVVSAAALVRTTCGR